MASRDGSGGAAPGGDASAASQAASVLLQLAAPDASVQLAGAEAILALCARSAACASLLSSGAVPALLLLVDADEPAPDATDAVRAAALSAIAALAHCSASAPAPFSSALVDAGGLHRLVAAMRVSGDGDLLRDASLALRCVALGGAHHDALRDSGALAQLVSVVWRCASKASPAERAIGAAAEALCAACTNCAANMAELLSDEDFVPLLSALLVPERPKCSIAAAALLMRVVASHGGEAGRKAVRASGGVEALHGAAAAGELHAQAALAAMGGA
jgi:hypothetical protein